MNRNCLNKEFKVPTPGNYWGCEIRSKKLSELHMKGRPAFNTDFFLKLRVDALIW